MSSDRAQSRGDCALGLLLVFCPEQERRSQQTFPRKEAGCRVTKCSLPTVGSRNTLEMVLPGKQTANYWRTRAATMRALILCMENAETKAGIAKLAADYDKRADRIENGGGGTPPKRPKIPKRVSLSRHSSPEALS